MPSTFLSLHYHLVFSTKHRDPLIDSVWRLQLHEYLGGTVKGLGGERIVGGTLRRNTTDNGHFGRN